jgi:membrane dipeptidase
VNESATIHSNAIVIDGHADTAQRFLDDGWDFTSDLGPGMLNLESARRGNLAAEFFALWVDPAEHPLGTHAARAFALLESVLEQVRRHPAELMLCLSAEDIASAHTQRKFGVLLGLEGGHAIENSLEVLREFFERGVRYMTLTWANHNDWADSSAGEPRHNGLTALGRDMVREMNRLGMMVDVSHVSDKTFWDVLEVSAAPVLATHSNARALTGVPRNLTDEQLRALAARGGMAMVNFYPGFVDQAWREGWEACRGEREAMQRAHAEPYHTAGKPVPFSVSTAIDRIFAQRIGRPPLTSLIDHFDHMIRVAGVDHVGVGSDFDGIPSLPLGIDSAADLPRITEALHARGYSAEDLRKVLGGNLLRMFGEVQKRAQPLRSPAPMA